MGNKRQATDDLTVRAPLLRVDLRVPDCWKLPHAPALAPLALELRILGRPGIAVKLVSQPREKRKNSKAWGSLYIGARKSRQA